MLDEAQLVAATSSVAAQMTSSLWRRHAWVVTGTPITARLEEIQASCLSNHRSSGWLHVCICINDFPCMSMHALMLNQGAYQIISC